MQDPESWSVRRRGLALPVRAAGGPLGLRGDHRARGFRGAQTYDDGERRFTVWLRGPGLVDWHYEASAGELRIDAVRGTDRGTELGVFRHHGEDFGLGDARLERPIGALLCNAIFGCLTLRRLRGPFRFADGAVDFRADFARETVVRYDGASGSLDAVPADGSLTLDALAGRRLGPDGALRIEVAANRSGARLTWRQVRGPRIGLRGWRSSCAEVRADALADGEQAAFVVGAAAGGALALDTVIVRAARRP